jgi:hypothetical protein
MARGQEIMKPAQLKALERLLTIKRSIEESAYKSRVEARDTLIGEAERLRRQSFSRMAPDDDRPSKIELQTAEHFREVLREKAARLQDRAQALEAEVSTARALTQHALRREKALEKLSARLQRQIRQSVNNRDEQSREQNTLLNY